MNVYKGIGTTLMILAIFGAIGFVGLQYFFIVLPADLAYQNKFGSYVQLAYEQSSFEGIVQEVNMIWRNMNESWPTGRDQVYNSPWPWDKTRENSLNAQDRYFSKLLLRTQQYLVQWQAIQSGKMIVTGDWYDGAIKNLRTEMKIGGGLAWAIRGAFYLSFYPLAYWIGFTDTLGVIVAVVLFFVGAGVYDYTRQEKRTW